MSTAKKFGICMGVMAVLSAVSLILVGCKGCGTKNDVQATNAQQRRPVKQPPVISDAEKALKDAADAKDIAAATQKQFVDLQKKFDELQKQNAKPQGQVGDLRQQANKPPAPVAPAISVPDLMKAVGPVAQAADSSTVVNIEQRTGRPAVIKELADAGGKVAEVPVAKAKMAPMDDPEIAKEKELQRNDRINYLKRKIYDDEATLVLWKNSQSYVIDPDIKIIRRREIREFEDKLTDAKKELARLEHQ